MNITAQVPLRISPDFIRPQEKIRNPIEGSRPDSSSGTSSTGLFMGRKNTKNIKTLVCEHKKSDPENVYSSAHGWRESHQNHRGKDTKIQVMLYVWHNVFSACSSFLNATISRRARSQPRGTRHLRREGCQSRVTIPTLRSLRSLVRGYWDVVPLGHRP